MSYTDVDHLAHIDTTIGTIHASLAANGHPTALTAGTELTDAVIRRLQTVSESAKELSTDLKAEHPEIPWREVAGFRDHLSHEHLSLDMDIVNDVVRDDLQPLQDVARHELDRRRTVELADADLELGL